MTKHLGYCPQTGHIGTCTRCKQDTFRIHQNLEGIVLVKFCTD